MKRKLLALFLLGLTAGLAGCSYRNDFVVVNQSDRTITVRYQLKDTAQPPARKSLSEFNQADSPWQELTKGQFQFDSLTGTFEVTVAPEEVVRLFFEYDYRIDQSTLAITSIKIEGSRGSIELEGRQAQTQFKLEDDTKYVLRYR